MSERDSRYLMLLTAVDVAGFVAGLTVGKLQTKILSEFQKNEKAEREREDRLIEATKDLLLHRGSSFH